jgi:hypothetical protein
MHCEGAQLALTWRPGSSYYKHWAELTSNILSPFQDVGKPLGRQTFDASNHTSVSEVKIGGA